MAGRSGPEDPDHWAQDAWPWAGSGQVEDKGCCRELRVLGQSLSGACPGL